MGFTMAGRAWYLVIWFVATPFILHRLGDERFGVWSLLFLLSGYLATFDFGLGASIVKFTAEHAARSALDPLRSTLAGINRLYLLLGLLWVTVIVAAHPLLLGWLKVSAAHAHEVRFALIASACIFAFANLASTGPGILTGLQRMDLSNGILIAASIPQLLVLLVGLHLGYGLYAVVASTAAQWLTTAALAWFALRRQAAALRWPSFAISGKSGGWLRFSSVMQANNLLGITQQQIDKPILTTLQGLRTVTQFELGFRVANGIQSLPVLALAPLMPAFAELHAAGQTERFQRLSVRGSHWISGGAFGLAACFIPVASLLVRAWVGPGFSVAESLAPWLLAGFALNMATGVATSAARGAGRPDLEFLPGLAGVVVHGLASWVLVSRVGPGGVGPAFCLSMAVWSVLCLWRFAAWTRIPLGAFLLTIFGRAGVAFGVGLTTGWWMVARVSSPGQEERLGLLLAALLAGAAAATVYAGLWWVLGRLLPRLSGEPPPAAAHDFARGRASS
jgi:O-antigen/teichoic acid export membrane protein